MRIDALSHLADAGIAINFAFGILEHYRGFITERVTKSLGTTADGLKAIVLDRFAEKSEAVQVESAIISSIPAALSRRTTWCQQVCLALAISCVIALVLFLSCAAIHGEASCTRLSPQTWTLIVLSLATGPIVLCVVIMSALYCLARLALWQLKRRYKIISDFTKKASIVPTEPGSVPPRGRARASSPLTNEEEQTPAPEA